MELVSRYEYGLIPAWAGKTCQFVLTWYRSPAHPRVGGENGMMVEAPKPGAAHPRVGGENR